MLKIEASDDMLYLQATQEEKNEDIDKGATEEDAGGSGDSTPADFFKYNVSLDRITNESDCFNFIYPETIYIIDTRFLLSIYPILTEVYENLLADSSKDLKTRSKKYDVENEKLMFLVDELQKFCLNKILFSSLDIEHNSYNFFRQTSIRSNYIIHVIIEIIQLLLPKNEINSVYKLYKKQLENERKYQQTKEGAIFSPTLFNEDIKSTMASRLKNGILDE